MEGKVYNGGGGGHFTVSVEIEMADSTDGHQNAGKDLQRLEISQTIVKEQTKVRVNGIDKGVYKVVFTDSNGDNYVTDKISASASAWTFR